MVNQTVPVIWPEYVQFGDATTPGPKIPFDRERAEKALRKNPKAFLGIEQAQTVFFTAVIRDTSKRPYEVIRRRYITPEECHGLLWCCIEKGLPPHVNWYMENLEMLSQREAEEYKRRTDPNRPAEGF